MYCDQVIHHMHAHMQACCDYMYAVESLLMCVMLSIMLLHACNFDFRLCPWTCMAFLIVSKRSRGGMVLLVCSGPRIILSQGLVSIDLKINNYDLSIHESDNVYLCWPQMTQQVAVKLSWSSVLLPLCNAQDYHLHVATM